MTMGTLRLATIPAARRSTNTTILINRTQAGPTASAPLSPLEVEAEEATASPVPTTISAIRRTNSLSIRRAGCGRMTRSGSCGEARPVQLSRRQTRSVDWTSLLTLFLSLSQLYPAYDDIHFGTFERAFCCCLNALESGQTELCRYQGAAGWAMRRSRLRFVTYYFSLGHKVGMACECYGLSCAD